MRKSDREVCSLPAKKSEAAVCQNSGVQMQLAQWEIQQEEEEAGKCYL